MPSDISDSESDDEELLKLARSMTGRSTRSKNKKENERKAKADAILGDAMEDSAKIYSDTVRIAMDSAKGGAGKASTREETQHFLRQHKLRPSAKSLGMTDKEWLQHTIEGIDANHEDFKGLSYDQRRALKDAQNTVQSSGLGTVKTLFIHPMEKHALPETWDHVQEYFLHVLKEAAKDPSISSQWKKKILPKWTKAAAKKVWPTMLSSRRLVLDCREHQVDDIPYSLVRCLYYISTSHGEDFSQCTPQLREFRWGAGCTLKELLRIGQCTTISFPNGTKASVIFVLDELTRHLTDWFGFQWPPVDRFVSNSKENQPQGKTDRKVDRPIDRNGLLNFLDIWTEAIRNDLVHIDQDRIEEVGAKTLLALYQTALDPLFFAPQPEFRTDMLESLQALARELLVWLMSRIDEEKQERWMNDFADKCVDNIANLIAVNDGAQSTNTMSDEWGPSTQSEKRLLCLSMLLRQVVLPTNEAQVNIPSCRLLVCLGDRLLQFCVGQDRESWQKRVDANLSKLQGIDADSAILLPLATSLTGLQAIESLNDLWNDSSQCLSILDMSYKLFECGMYLNKALRSDTMSRIRNMGDAHENSNMDIFGEMDVMFAFYKQMEDSSALIDQLSHRRRHVDRNFQRLNAQAISTRRILQIEQTLYQRHSGNMVQKSLDSFFKKD